MIALLLACSDVEQGTVVGNPGDTMTVAADGKDVSFEESTGFAVGWHLTDCSGTPTEEELNDAIDLAGEILELPHGTWCGVGLELIEIEIEGFGANDAGFYLDLEGGLVELASDEGVAVDGGTYVFELAEEGWIDAEDLDLRDGEDVEIDERHEAYDGILEALLRGSALYVDSDADGFLHPDERDAGAEATGDLREDDRRDGDTGDAERDDDGDGRGCATAPVGGGLLLALLMLHRRRTRAV